MAGGWFDDCPIQSYAPSQ